MSELDMTLHVPVDEVKAKALHDGLANAGQTLPASQIETFLLVIEDAAGALIGGCKGDIAFKSAHISELWVDEAYQGKGLGRQLLKRAETHVRERDCMRIHLETRSEAARALYEKVGYRVFGTLADYHDAQAFYYLEKRLDP